MKKEKMLLAKMDKKLYEQLRQYSYHKKQSLAETARQAINKFIKEEYDAKEKKKNSK